jgi:predicted Zn-dependent peptidase
MRKRLRQSHIPFNALFLGYHVPSIYEDDFHAVDLLSAILADGESSRLYREIEYTQQIASETEAFIDEGELSSMLYVYGVAQNGKVTPKQLERALLEEIRKVAEEGVEERELEKVKNRRITRIIHALQSISNRAERLAYFGGIFNDADLAFREAKLYEPITIHDIQRVARKYLLDAKPNALAYEVSK